MEKILTPLTYRETCNDHNKNGTYVGGPIIKKVINKTT